MAPNRFFYRIAGISLAVGLCMSHSYAASRSSGQMKGDWFPDQDRKAYELLLKSYQKQNVEQLQSFVDTFDSKFSSSPLRDNAKLMLAQLYMEKKMWSSALKPLNEILKHHVTSERWPAALYHKGLVYQQAGRVQHSKRIWTLLMKRFPGSQESQKAWIALRLMNSDNKAKP